MTEHVVSATADLSQAQVAAFLRAHPAFFDHHPELLQSLGIAHDGAHNGTRDAGQAVSRQEREVVALREENQRLQSRFDGFLHSARENEVLIGQIHRLALALMAAVGPQAIFNLLLRLADDFKAAQVTALVFALPAYVDSADLPQFVGRDSKRREPFAEMLTTGATVCGPLSLTQTHALFNGEDFRGSHVVLPLAAEHWDGLIAVSSADSERFGPELGTEFLAFLRDVVTLVVAPWIAKPRQP